MAPCSDCQSCPAVTFSEAANLKSQGLSPDEYSPPMPTYPDTELPVKLPERFSVPVPDFSLLPNEAAMKPLSSEPDCMAWKNGGIQTRSRNCGSLTARQSLPSVAKTESPSKSPATVTALEYGNVESMPVAVTCCACVPANA